MIYIKLLLVAFVAVFVVDVSGFTESWKGALQRWLKIGAIRSIKPFDCSLCMTWWSCIIYALCVSELSIFTIAYSAAMAALSIPIGQIIQLIKERLCNIIDKLMPR